MSQRRFNLLYDRRCEPCNMALSNMAGPLKAPLVFKGKKVDWVSFGATADGPSISIVTHHDCAKISIMAD